MVLRGSLYALALGVPGMMLAAQGPAGPAPETNSPPPAAANSASATLQPSLDILKQAVAGMSIDRWKASPAIRDEATANLRSV
jgi:hypothetical protein